MRGSSWLNGGSADDGSRAKCRSPQGTGPYLRVMPDAERKWPRWWDMDDWLLLAILAPAGALLRRLRRLRWRSMRLALSGLVVTVTAVLLVLLVIAIGGG